MDLDIKTFNLIITGLSILQALFLLIYHKFIPDIKGPWYWLWGYFISGIGFYLLSFNGVIDDFFTIALPQTMFLVGQILGIAGLLHYLNKKINWFLLTLIPVVGFLISAFFTIIYVNHEVRTIIITIMYIIYGLINIYILKSQVKGAYKSVFQILIIVFAVYIFVMIIRIAMVTITHLVNIMETNTVSEVVFIVTMVLQFGVFFSFLMLINAKISDNLTQNINTKNKFFSIIAHDLKGPISSIRDALKFLVESKNNIDPEEMQSLISEMKDQSVNTYNLLENLLDWARNESGALKINKQQLNLKFLIDNTIGVLSFQAKQKKIEIINSIDDYTYVIADYATISTVFRNLISNSLKFTNPGGIISVSCKNMEKFALITLADNGIGIPKDRQEKLFIFGENETTYGTQGEKGTGVGLILCNELVRKNDGSMTIDSVENDGTSITIKLNI